MIMLKSLTFMTMLTIFSYPIDRDEWGLPRDLIKFDPEGRAFELIDFTAYSM